MYLTGRSSSGGVYQGIFPWLVTHCQPVLHKPAWQKLTQSPLNGTTQPVYTEKENPSTDRQNG